VAGDTAADYPVTGPATGLDYAQADELASQPDIAEPSAMPAEPAGRHHAAASGADVTGDPAGAYADQADLNDPDADLNDPDAAEPAAASRLPWRK
jgi:hypothetical protein